MIYFIDFILTYLDHQYYVVEKCLTHYLTFYHWPMTKQNRRENNLYKNKNQICLKMLQQKTIYYLIFQKNIVLQLLELL